MFTTAFEKTAVLKTLKKIIQKIKPKPYKKVQMDTKEFAKVQAAGRRLQEPVKKDGK